MTLKTRLFSVLIFFPCLFVVAESPVYAQATDVPAFEHNVRPGISLNYSPHSFKGWGTIRNSKMAFVSGQLWHSSLNLDKIKARFASELIFAHWVRYPINGKDGPTEQRFGFGVVPIHMIIPFSDKPFTPFFSASVGFLFLNDRLPSIDGASINYKLSSGLGVEIPIGADRKIQVGYYLQHISNGNSSVENPGIDSHVFFANLVFAEW